MFSDPSNSYTRIVVDAGDLIDACSELREHWTLGSTGPWRLTFEPHKETRRLAQNRRYWALVNEWTQQALQHMDGEWHAPEVWHEFFKRRFLGVDAIEVMGKPVPMVRDSRTLKVGEFAEYMEQVEAWMVEHGLEHMGDL